MFYSTDSCINMAPTNCHACAHSYMCTTITDHFSCISANLIFCISCTLCNKIYICKMGHRLGDHFCEHLRDVEINIKDASKPVARHFNLPNHSQNHMAVCGLSLHLGNTESRKNIEQIFIFQIGTLSPRGINKRFSFLGFSYIILLLVSTISHSSSFPI